MRVFFTSVLAVMLIGCAVSEQQLAFNRYSIETEYGGDIGYFEAVDELIEKAVSICDGPYRKTNDYDTVQGEDKLLLVWEVACEGADRSESESMTNKVDLF